MTDSSRDRRPFGWAAWLFSALVLTAGLVVSVQTGEWWALVVASGLAVAPVTVRRRAT
jgi:hypothetical protein